MELKQVRYGATINLGNYESVKLELEYDIHDGDTIEGVRGEAMSHFREEALKSNVEGSHFLKV